jgi:CRISPR-associated protein Csx1
VNAIINEEINAVRLLIAVWGSPWYIFKSVEAKSRYSWVPVSYIYRGVSDSSKKWRTTIPLLLEVLKPTKTLIFVPESVVYEPINDYEELKKYIHGIYREFLEKECGIPLNRGIDINVLPSVGRYKNKITNHEYLRVEIHGSPLNYAYMLALNIAQVIETLLVEHFESFDKTLEVYLDISHGMNFMPVIARVTLQELLNIIATFINTKLIVLNSEPVPREEVEEVGICNILEIESHEDLMPTQLSFTYLRTLNLLIDEELSKQKKTIATKGSLLTPLEEIKDENTRISIIERGHKILLDIIPREKLGDLLAFAAAFQHILPLWIFYFKSRLRNIESIKPISALRTKLEAAFSEFTKIDFRDSTLSITHFASIGSVTLEIVKAILALHTLSAAGYKGCEEAELEELKMKKLRDMPGTFRYLKLRVERDIGQITHNIIDVCKSDISSRIINRNVALIEIEALKKEALKEHSSKKELISPEELEQKCKQIEEDVNSIVRKVKEGIMNWRGITNSARNIVAHSGLEHCTVEAIVDVCLKDESEVKRRIRVRPRSNKAEYVEKLLRLELL